ncbi:MAG: glycosyltransferase [Saprospiraceae bacterium]
MVELFQLADVFVTTALEDNFPNTIIESMSCGTPVVGFDYSGISEMIQHKKTGYLAAYKSSEDIARGIEWILNHSRYDQLSEAAIQYVSDECNPLQIANQYIDLYQKSIN